MISIIQNGDSKIAPKTIVVSSLQDLTSLATACVPGSVAYRTDNLKGYMFADRWYQIPDSWTKELIFDV